MKQFPYRSKKLAMLCCVTLLPLSWAHAVESQPDRALKKAVPEKIKPFSVESMDMDQLAVTFGTKLSTWYFRYQEYPAAVAQLHLSDTQKVKLIAALRVSKARALSDERRSYSISRLFEHWGQYKKAIEELGTPEASLHRARLLLKSGDRAAALAEGKRYFTESKVEGFQSSAFTGFPLTGLTHPYIAMEDFKGMDEYLKLLADLSPWRQDIRLAQLDLAYHLGTIDEYAAQLQKKHPIRYIMYLQQIGRYADALDALTEHRKRVPLSFQELVFLLPAFKNHQLLQSSIQEMISSGEGGAETRKKLLSAIVQHDSNRVLTYMNLWLKTHPKELDRWASDFAYKMIPSNSSKARVGQFLDDLHRTFPDNPVVAVCLAQKLTLQHGEQAPEVVKILSRVVRRHLKEKSIDDARLPDWSKNSTWSRNSANYFFNEPDIAEPVAVALSMLRTRMDAQTLLNLLHEAPEFSKLPLAQKARYYAITRLDQPFFEAMLSLDWSRKENDNRAMWLSSYFNPDYFKDSIPAEYLDELASKLSAISMGSSGKFKDISSNQELAPLLKMLLAKHPQPESLIPTMRKLESDIKANPDLDAYLIFPTLRYLQRAHPSVQGIFELEKLAPDRRELVKRTGLNARLFYGVKLFSAPDIKRLQHWRSGDRSRINFYYRTRSRMNLNYRTRHTEKYRAIDPLQYLFRRNWAYSYMMKPGEIAMVLRSSYPALSEYALAYDLLQQLMLPKNKAEDIDQFLKTLDQSDTDLILYEAAVKSAYNVPNQVILKTLNRLKSAPVTHRKRAIQFAQRYDKKIQKAWNYSRSSNPSGGRKKPQNEFVEAVTQLMNIEPRVGLVPKPEEINKDEKIALEETVGERFVQFRNNKQYQSQECQELARKVLWSLINGNEPKATVIHYQAKTAMEHIGAFATFFTEVDAKLKSRGMDELQRLKRLRRFYSYSSKGNVTKLKYSRKIRALDPNDFMAANDLLPEYVKKENAEEVMRCLTVISSQVTDQEITNILRNNSRCLTVLNSDQVGELLQLLRIKPLKNPQAFAQYLAGNLPRLFEKNKMATREYLTWLKQSDQDVFTIQVLNAVLKLGLRESVLKMVSTQLFPAPESSQAGKVSIRFGKPKMPVNRRYQASDSELFQLVVGNGMAKDLLKLRMKKIDTITVNSIQNRFILELLAAPSRETYTRIAPHTVSRVSSGERTEMCVTLRSLLQGVSGGESLQLFLSQTMLAQSIHMSPSEISHSFKLAYLAKEPDAVEATWNHLDTFVKKDKITQSPDKYFLRSDEYCLMSTLLFGSDRRWLQLMRIYSENDRYKKEDDNRSFSRHVLKNIQKGTNGNLRKIPTIRGRKMLEVAMKRMREIDAERWADSRTEHAYQWVLLAAQLGDERALKYFYPKALKKVNNSSSDRDMNRDELDFWIGVMKADPSVASPVVHAYRSGNQWHALWSMSGVPQRQYDLGLPDNMISQSQGESKERYKITLLAGPSPQRLDEVKTLSKAEVSGSVEIDLPEDARWLGMMVRADNGKAVRWANPIKLSAASAAKVDMAKHFSKQSDLALPIKLIKKAGPFGLETAIHLELPIRQKIKLTTRLIPLAWKPGDTLFGSAWVKTSQRGAVSLAVGFYGKSDEFLGAVDFQRKRNYNSRLPQESLLPDTWEYVSTLRDRPIPPLAHHAVFILKTNSYSDSSSRRRFIELSDLRIQVTPALKSSDFIRRIGRVPGAMYYLCASDDDQRILLVDKEAGIWLFDVERGSSRKITNLKKQTKVFWARLNGEVLYYLDHQYQFRGLDIKTGKETVHQSLLELRNTYPKIAISPNGKWLAVVAGNRKINIYQIKEDEIVKMKPVPLPEGVVEFQFYVNIFDFDAASNLTILAGGNYWKFSPETQLIKPLGRPIQRNDNPPFGPQGDLFFDRPLTTHDNRWLDPKRKQQISFGRSNRGMRSIKYYADGKKQKINLPHDIPQFLPIFTLFPKSGDCLYVDSMGILWRVTSPLPLKEKAAE